MTPEPTPAELAVRAELREALIAELSGQPLSVAAECLGFAAGLTDEALHAWMGAES